MAARAFLAVVGACVLPAASWPRDARLQHGDSLRGEPLEGEALLAERALDAALDSSS